MKIMAGAAGLHLSSSSPAVNRNETFVVVKSSHVLETLDQPSLLARSVDQKVIHKTIPADRLLSLNKYARSFAKGEGESSGVATR